MLYLVRNINKIDKDQQHEIISALNEIVNDEKDFKKDQLTTTISSISFNTMCCIQSYWFYWIILSLHLCIFIFYLKR